MRINLSWIVKAYSLIDVYGRFRRIWLLIVMVEAVIFFSLRGNFWNVDAEAKVRVKRVEAGAVNNYVFTEGMEFRLAN